MTDGPTTPASDDASDAPAASASEQVFTHRYPFSSEEIILIVAALLGGPIVLLCTGSHAARTWLLVGGLSAIASFWLYRIGASRKSYSQVTARLKGSYLRVTSRLTYVGNTEVDLANLARVSMKPDTAYPLVVLTSDERTARVPARLFKVDGFRDATQPYLTSESVEVTDGAKATLGL